MAFVQSWLSLLRYRVRPCQQWGLFHRRNTAPLCLWEAKRKKCGWVWLTMVLHTTWSVNGNNDTDSSGSMWWFVLNAWQWNGKFMSKSRSYLSSAFGRAPFHPLHRRRQTISFARPFVATTRNCSIFYPFLWIDTMKQTVHSIRWKAIPNSPWRIRRRIVAVPWHFRWIPNGIWRRAQYLCRWCGMFCEWMNGNKSEISYHSNYGVNTRTTHLCASK